MRNTAIRLRLALALLAWFAQLCLPAVHASVLATPGGTVPGWCGDPAHAVAFADQLPAEIREALGLDGVDADQFAGCAQLCATGATPAIATFAAALTPPAAGGAPQTTFEREPSSRAQSPKPPSRGPPPYC